MQEMERILQSFHIDYSANDLQIYFQDKLASILTVTNISVFFNRFISTLGNFFIAFFAISFLTFFFLKDEKKIIETSLSIVPENYTQKIKTF